MTDHAIDIALPLIQRFEGFRSNSYFDNYGHVWTIGYGRTGHVRKGMRTTPEAEEGWMRHRIEHDLMLIDGWTDYALNDKQRAALASFVYNLGTNALHHSTMLHYIVEGRLDDAAAEFPKWIHAGGKVLPGLVSRRKAERELFEGKSNGV